MQGLHQLSECQLLASPMTFVPVFIMCSEFAVTIAQFVKFNSDRYMSSKCRSIQNEPLFCEVKNNESEQSEDSTLPVGPRSTAMDTLIHQHLH